MSRRDGCGRCASSRGSAVVTMVLVLALIGVAAAVLAGTARATSARARAQGAADAVALAAAVDPALAPRLAHDNGAVLERLVMDADGVEVTVSRDGVRATARAIVDQCRGSCPSVP